MEGGTEEGMMAVGTVIMNRIDSSSYPNSLTEVIYAPMQFEVTTFPQFTNYISNPSTIPESAIRCATALLSGSRENRLMTCPYPSARNRGPCTAFYTDLPNLRRSTPMGISIAGNWFHWHW